MKWCLAGLPFGTSVMVALEIAGVEFFSWRWVLCAFIIATGATITAMLDRFWVRNDD